MFGIAVFNYSVFIFVGKVEFSSSGLSGLSGSLGSLGSLSLWSL